MGTGINHSINEILYMSKNKLPDQMAKLIKISKSKFLNNEFSNF